MSAAALVDDARLEAAPHALAPTLYDGRTVLVSGGGSGIGKAATWLLSRLGANLIICGRSQDRVDAVAAALTHHDRPVLAIACDIRDDEAVERLFDAAGERFGAIDLVVNNAGGQYPQAGIDIKPKGWRAVVETNLTGSWLMMQAAARKWIAAERGGAIVNIVASCSRGMPGIIHSSAARAGVINASRTAAVEWAPYGIRINCVAAGLIETAGLDVYPPEARAGFLDANPQRAFGDPWDVAQLIAFLGSDAARFMTGSSVTIDGGSALWGELWTHGRPDYFATGAALDAQ